MDGPTLERMCPFFIVSDVERTIAFYRDMLGFAVWNQEPAANPFFAILSRDEAMLFVKSGTGEPIPNSQTDTDMKWDTYVTVQDPDALAAEFSHRGATLSSPPRNTHEGLRGFEITDPDGYVLFFGRPT